MSLQRDSSKDPQRQGSPLRLVLEFYQRVDKPIRSQPTLEIPDSEIRQLLNLLDEESTELKIALGKHDIIDVADALGDIVYVIYGAALQFGIDLDRVLESVHLANMSKPNSDGSVARSREGKILRGDSYRPPAVGEVLGIFDGTGRASDRQ